MLKNRGQALVEFIIILPIFLILVLGVIDMSKILYSKIILEEKMSDIIALIDKGNNVQDINDKLDGMIVNVEVKDNYVNYSLEKNIDIITPGLNFVLKNPYNLKVKRSIINE